MQTGSFFIICIIDLYTDIVYDIYKDMIHLI